MSKVIEWEDGLVGKAYDVAEFLLKERVKCLHKYDNYILDEVIPDLEMLITDLKMLCELDSTLVKVFENPMGGYYISELKEVAYNEK